VRVTVCRPLELGAAEVATWHELQVRTGLESPFLSPEFAQDVDATTSHARVAVLSDGPQTVGFFPFELGRLRTARGIGGILANCQALIAAPEAQIAIDHVLRAAKVDVFTFHALLPPQRPTAGFTRRVPSLTIDLTQGLPHYVAHRRETGGNFFREIERKRRRFAREHEGTVEYRFATHDRAAVAEMIRWKSAQYRRTGRPDPFSPAARDLLERLLARNGDALSGAVSTLSLEGRPVAVDVSLRSQTVLAAWFTAYDPELAVWSPGAIGILSYIEAALGAGLRTLELATGDEEFKRRLADGSVEMLDGWIGRPSVGLAVDRATRAPTSWAHRYIVSHPRLRRFTRSALRQYGELRTRA
jgi:CelD/BcsL family acetyltransferase involved in cellulose biosynthesis